MVTTTTNRKAKTLAEDKLAQSGLTLDDAKELGIEVLSNTQTAKLHSSFNSLSSLKINYYDHKKKPLPDWNKSQAFYRLRYLEVPKDFTSQTKKPVRYVQQPNTAPVAYYPKNQDWGDIVSNIHSPLIITEGELKAAKACKEGFPTIGLGGVYNWKSLKLGVEWIESLNLVKWIKRHVYICFDSDYQTNPMVCAALREFANELERRGSFVYIVCLPQLHGLEKVGLDDFLVHAGPTSIQMFNGLLTNAEPLGLSAPLWGLNDEYVYVKNPGLIINQETFFKVTPGAFKEHLESATQYQERQLRSDGTISFKTVSAAAAWLKWPLRTEVLKLTYRPGDPKFTKSDPILLNTWPGWGIQPKKGDAKPFLALVDHLFSGANKGAKEWFLSWCAYPLQYPGTKMFTSAVLHGIRHGTGKSLVGYTLGRIYGENFTEISQMDLHNSFNDWAEAKQFIMGDDVTGSNKRQDADFLKKLITQRELRVNPKYIPSYTVPDCINYFFTANHPDSFFLEDDDRRNFIHEVQVGPLSEEFYVEYDLWVDTGGANAVFDYLLKYDTKNFNPAAPAFRTDAKERMIANVQSDLAGWVRQLLRNPDHVLRVGNISIEKDLFTNKELLTLYDAIGKTGTTANGLGRELSRAGFRQAFNGRPMKLDDGSQDRYYIIRNHDKWINESSIHVLKKHLETWNSKSDTKKNKTKKY